MSAPGPGEVGAAIGPLALRLSELAREGGTMTYGALARQLGLRMVVLTGALEQLMAEDAAVGRPYRAALCEARLGQGMPAPGFFMAAEALSRPVAPTPQAVAEERAALFARASSDP